jgi:hypothetical protein
MRKIMWKWANFSKLHEILLHENVRFCKIFFAKISQKFCDEINLQFRWNFDFIESKKKDFRGTPNSGRKICYLWLRYLLLVNDIWCILLIALANRSEKNHTHVFHYFIVVGIIWFRSKLNRLQLHHERIRKHKTQNV